MLIKEKMTVPDM